MERPKSLRNPKKFELKYDLKHEDPKTHIFLDPTRINSEDPSIRAMNIGSALKQIKNKKLYEELIDHALNDPVKEVRFTAFLQSFRKEKRLDLIKRGLNDKAKDIVAFTLMELKNFDDYFEELKPIVTNLLYEHPDELVKDYCMDYLTLHDTKENCLSMGKKLITNPNPFLRALGIDFFISRGDKQNLVTIERMLDDPEIKVRKKAIEFMRVAGNQDLRYHRLYQDITASGNEDFFNPEKKFVAKEFEKDNSRTILLGGKWVGKIIFRDIPRRHYDVWLEILKLGIPAEEIIKSTDKETQKKIETRKKWAERKGFELPKELETPFLGPERAKLLTVRKEHNDKLGHPIFFEGEQFVRVATKVINGPPVGEFLTNQQNNKKYGKVIMRQVDEIKKIMGEHGIHHIHTGLDNFVIDWQKNPDGTQFPKVIIIDFDMAMQMRH